MSPNLVFATGVLVPQRILGHDYFRGLAAIYPAETTLFARVSALGSVEMRAAELARAIAAKFPAGEVHVVAHSMGGLDTRCLLAQDMEGLASGGRVVSLSTISTPHHGSPLANLVLGGLYAVELPFRSILAEFPALTGQVVADLSTEGAPGFKEKDPVAGVKYFCYAGKTVESELLHPLHFYINAREGENDGVVSVASATWPEQLAEEPWEADHISEIGYNLNRPGLNSTFPHVEAVARIVKRATS